MWKKRKTCKNTHTTKSDTGTDTHGLTKAGIHSLSGLRGLIYPPTSFRNVCECSCGGMMYTSRASAPLQHSSDSEARATRITYLYRPIWQHCTPHSHHIHRLTTVCEWEHTVCTQSRRWTVSFCSFNRSKALKGKNATMFPEKPTCCLAFSHIHAQYIRSRWQWKYLYLCSVLLW